MGLRQEINTLFPAYAAELDYPVTTRGKPFSVPRTARGVEAPYLRYANLEARPDLFALEYSGSSIHSGIFQVDVMIPQDMEQGAAQDLVDMVCNKFKRGTRLGSVKVERPPYTGPELQEDTYRVIPVSIVWVSYRQGAQA